MRLRLPHVYNTDTPPSCIPVQSNKMMAEVGVDSCATEKPGLVGESRLEAIVAERAVSKSRVPAGAIPRGVNYLLGGFAG